MEFFNDEYTLDIDALGYRAQADAVTDLVLNCVPPYAVAISGRWGSGKTSFMKYIMARLGGKPTAHRLKFQDQEIFNREETEKFRKHEDTKLRQHQKVECIWFNPWEHEDHAEPFVELLKEFHKHFSHQLANAVRKELHLVIQAGLDILGSVLKVGENRASRIREMGETYEYENFQYSTRDSRLKLLLQEAIDKFLDIGKQDKKGGSARARLVIFIDDLDRCEETVIAALLKQIKQYLSLQHCVFVFGYDRHHIERALSRHSDRRAKETRAYIEKLFQTTVYLKQPDPGKEKEFIGSLLTDSGCSGFFHSKQDRSAFTDFLLRILDPNPRRIKLFVRGFYFHLVCGSFYHKAADGSVKPVAREDLEKLALITVLKLFYEPVFTALENKPELIGDIANVLNSGVPQQAENWKQCFLHLELRSHLREARDFIPDEMGGAMDKGGIARLIDPLFSDPAAESKFLNEVYEMQGRHKSFEGFADEFFKRFSSCNTEDLLRYL
jgi:ABC-type dipeptide/oligopeptide/nickel transport system ATPase component